MAVKIEKKYVCDVCGHEGEVTHWRIVRGSDNRTVTPDLCPEHSAMILELFAKMPTGKRGQARARRVLTPEEEKALRGKVTKKSTVASRKPAKGH